MVKVNTIGRVRRALLGDVDLLDAYGEQTQRCVEPRRSTSAGIVLFQERRRAARRCTSIDVTSGVSAAYGNHCGFRYESRLIRWSWNSASAARHRLAAGPATCIIWHRTGLGMKTFSFILICVLGAIQDTQNE